MSDNDDKTRIQRANADDKTRIKTPTQEGTHTPESSSTPASRPPASADNKTVVKPRSTSSPKAAADDAKTVVKPAAKPQANPTIKPTAADDGKTVFKPPVADEGKTVFKRPSTSDETVVTRPDALSNASASSAGQQSAVAEQYANDGHELLKNRFVFEKLLGAGGMGEVYKAKDLLKVEAQDRDPYVAIKVLSDEFKSHPEAFIALQRESRKTQRIAHPNIVNVHDFDRDGDKVFMTMEFLEGQPLDELIRGYKSTGLPEELAWKILEGISKALIYAHEQSIIHSDFKPGNIFVTSKEVSKVFDFGIARAVAKAEKLEESVDDKTVFDAGNLGALTPAYASLEMLEGETPDVRDDIYALGCIAYEMFTGQHPFNRVHANEAMRQKMRPRRIPNISKRQWKVIEKALAFKREDRIATVDEFWAQITKKRSSGVMLSTVATILVAVASVLLYQTYFVPEESTFDELNFRSEIEREFTINQNKEDLEELLGTLEFSNTWQDDVWESVQVLRQLLGSEDAWLSAREALVYQAYVDRVESETGENNFDQAKALLTNAGRYSSDEAALAALLSGIENAERALAKQQADERARRLAQQQENQRREAERQEVQRVSREFDRALDNVNEQLACRTTLNMGDIRVAVDKLRSLDLGRYQQAEGELLQKLSRCISTIGRSRPERAEEFKLRAQRIFPDNSVVADIKIEPKDPCDLSLAGLGSRGPRAVCRDILKSDGDNLGRGPALVVVPGRGSVKPFAIGKYEVSVDDLNMFCQNDNACTPSSGDGRMPRVNVSADIINAYLQWLSATSQRKYRLPTRAEWTYAVRAGNAKLDPNRICYLNSLGIIKGGKLERARSGGQNAWGLVNTVGNARELVTDRGNFLAVGGHFDTPMSDCVIETNESHGGGADAFTGLRLLREISQS